MLHIPLVPAGALVSKQHFVFPEPSSQAAKTSPVNSQATKTSPVNRGRHGQYYQPRKTEFTGGGAHAKKAAKSQKDRVEKSTVPAWMVALVAFAVIAQVFVFALRGTLPKGLSTAP